MNEPWMMHSCSYRCLFVLQLLEFVQDGDTSKPTFFGRDIVVDDKCDRNPLLEGVAWMLVEKGIV